MKIRVVIAVCLIAFAFVFSVISVFAVKNISSEIITLLEAALDERIAGNTSSEKIVAAMQTWEKNKAIFGTLLKHSNMVDLDKCFSSVEFSLKTQQEESLQQAISDCIGLLEATAEREKLTIDNIF